MTLSDKPKLKTQQRKLPLWARISDVLRLAKPFEIRVNLSEEQCLEAIRWFGMYRPGVKNFYKPRREGDVITINHTLEAFPRSTLICSLYEDENMEITRVTGKVYYHRELKWWILTLVVSTLLLIFPLTHGEMTSLCKTIAFFFLANVAFIWAAIEDTQRFLRNFKTHLKEAEANPASIRPPEIHTH
jgi:hypothetical protein